MTKIKKLNKIKTYLKTLLLIDSVFLSTKNTHNEFKLYVLSTIYFGLFGPIDMSS